MNSMEERKRLFDQEADYVRRIVAYQCYSIRKHMEYDDIVQDCLICLWKMTAKYDPTCGTTFRQYYTRGMTHEIGWLLERLFRRGLCRVGRGRKVKVDSVSSFEWDDREGYGDKQPFDLIDTRISHDRIVEMRDTFEKLPEIQQQLLEHVYRDGMTQEQATASIARSHKTAFRYVRAARLALRKLIEKDA